MSDLDNLIDTIDSLVDWQMTESPAAQVQSKSESGWVRGHVIMAVPHPDGYSQLDLRDYDTEATFLEALQAAGVATRARIWIAAYYRTMRS